MSTTTNQSSTSTTDDLLGRFRNVRTVFQNRVVAKPNGSVLHRLALDASADQPAPACPAGTSASERGHESQSGHRLDRPLSVP